MSLHNKGLPFRSHQHEEVLARFDMRIPDLHALFDKQEAAGQSRLYGFDCVTENYTNQKFSLNRQSYLKLPLDDKLDYKRIGLTPIKTADLLLRDEQAHLQIRVTDMTKARGMLMPNPNAGIIEERRQKESYGFKDIGFVVARANLALTYWVWLR